MTTPGENWVTLDSRRKVPGRDAATDYRQRIAEAQRLAKQRVPLPEIAQRLNADLATVRGWIRRQSQ